MPKRQTDRQGERERERLLSPESPFYLTSNGKGTCSRHARPLRLCVIDRNRSEPDGLQETIVFAVIGPRADDRRSMIRRGNRAARIESSTRLITAPGERGEAQSALEYSAESKSTSYPVEEDKYRCPISRINQRTGKEDRGRCASAARTKNLFARVGV